MNDDWNRHREAAENKAKALAGDAYQLTEQLAGWAHTAQLDDAVLTAANEARSAVRKIRNLLNPDETFKDEIVKRKAIFDELG